MKAEDLAPLAWGYGLWKCCFLGLYGVVVTSGVFCVQVSRWFKWFVL